MLCVSNSCLQFRDVLCVAKNLEFLHSTPFQTKSRRAQFNWWAKPVSTGTMFTVVTIKLNARIKQLYACIPAPPRLLTYRTWGFATGSVYSKPASDLDVRHSQQKSVNLQYNTLGRLDDGSIESSTKHLMFQVLFFFMISFKILCKNPLNLFSYFFL